MGTGAAARRGGSSLPLELEREGDDSGNGEIAKCVIQKVSVVEVQRRREALGVPGGGIWSGGPLGKMMGEHQRKA